MQIEKVHCDVNVIVSLHVNVYVVYLNVKKCKHPKIFVVAKLTVYVHVNVSVHVNVHVHVSGYANLKTQYERSFNVNETVNVIFSLHLKVSVNV